MAAVGIESTNKAGRRLATPEVALLGASSGLGIGVLAKTNLNYLNLIRRDVLVGMPDRQLHGLKHAGVGAAAVVAAVLGAGAAVGLSHIKDFRSDNQALVNTSLAAGVGGGLTVGMGVFKNAPEAILGVHQYAVGWGLMFAGIMAATAFATAPGRK